MSTRQAEYNVGLSDIRADIAEFRADMVRLAAKTGDDISKLAAKTGDDISKLAAENKADIANLTTEMARRETRMMFGAMATAGLAVAVIGVFIGLLAFA